MKNWIGLNSGEEKNLGNHILTLAIILTELIVQSVKLNSNINFNSKINKASNKLTLTQ